MTIKINVGNKNERLDGWDGRMDGWMTKGPNWRLCKKWENLIENNLKGLELSWLF